MTALRNVFASRQLLPEACVVCFCAYERKEGQEEGKGEGGREKEEGREVACLVSGNGVSREMCERR